jgi:hypothetical protein
MTKTLTIDHERLRVELVVGDNGDTPADASAATPAATARRDA